MNIRTAVIISLILMMTAEEAISQQSNYKVVCYYGSWANYRPGIGQFNASNIDLSLCTHFIYSFIGVNSNGTIKILDFWNDIVQGGFANFVALRSKSPSTKFMVALGGASESSATFSSVVKNSTLRSNLVESSLNFLTQYNFDGLDLDWEYPASNGGAPEDKANFVLLVQQLRNRINSMTGTKPVLSAAVGAGLSLLNTAYDAQALAPLLDWIGLMTYDYHGSWETVTGQNSPLYAASIDQDKTLNANATVLGWLAKVLANKLVMGVALYGRSFTLKSPTKAGLGAPASGLGTAGPYVKEAGYLGYNEICEQQLTGAWKVTFDNTQKVPYASNNTGQWVGYDNINSVKAKADFIKQKGLAGGMVWSIDTDDFRGVCNKTNKFPLLTTLKKALIP